MKKTGLGRGLDELLPVGEEVIAQMVQEIDIGDIDPNESQPRRDFAKETMMQLAASIGEVGVLQPILVVSVGRRYRIIAGERRWRAARIAGLKTIPAIVRDFDMVQQMEAALVENLQREDLNPVEEAAGMRALMQQCGYTQDALAKRLGKSRSAVANLLRILTLPEEVIAMVEKGSISAGHAKVLAGISDPRKQMDLATQTVLKGYSVRQLEQLAAKADKPKKEKKKDQLPIELMDMETRLRETLGVRTTFQGNEKKGKIILQYYSPEELERIYQAVEKLAVEQG